MTVLKPFYFLSVFFFLDFCALAQHKVAAERLLQADFLGESRPLREIKPKKLTREESGKKKIKDIPNFKARENKNPLDRNLYPQIDPLWKKTPSRKKSKNKSFSSSIKENFDGISYSNVSVPDPAVDVGLNHVVQMVNGPDGVLVEIYDKKGNTLYGPANWNSFWAEFGLKGFGDPIVMYDKLADRWFLSEFASPNQGSYLLIAISTTSDPMGSYYTYRFTTPFFPDYPKYSTWSNAYYCTTNEGETVVYAMDREAMLAGKDTDIQRFVVPSLSGFGFQSLTPVDWDGTTMPPANTPGYFWRHIDDEAHFSGTNDLSKDYLEYWQLHVDFTNKYNSALEGPVKIPITEFDSDINGYTSFSGVRQKGSSTTLDPLREVIMNRIQYRNFGMYEVIVGCHVTDIDGTDRVGIRWYELRKTGETWELYQEGTYSPDSENRWMASISMDKQGNIALAYSVAGVNTYPSLRYTGRLGNDPLGTMSLTERTIVEGNASNNNNRFGDYAMMNVDPSDDMTFWFTGQYNLRPSWSTRIVSFALSCDDFTINNAIICLDETGGTLEVTTQSNNSTLYYSIDGVNFQESPIFSGLSKGIYEIRVKNEKNCQLSTFIPIEEYTPLQVTTQVAPALCPGLNTGKLEVEATGNIGVLSYSIDGGNTYQASSLFDEIASGTYTILIKDSGRCMPVRQQITIYELIPLNLTVEVTDADCYGGATGKIKAEADGGTGTILYSIDGGVTFQTSNLFENLAAGDDYRIIIQDENGCSTSVDNIVLAEPKEIVCQLISHRTETATNVRIESTGGTGTHLYSLDGINFQKENQFLGLQTGTYSLFIQDESKCTVQKKITLREVERAISISPNPGNGHFQLKITLIQEDIAQSYSLSGNLKFELINVLGQLVYSNEYELEEEALEEDFYLNLSSGIYRARFSLHGKEIIKHLVIQN